MATQLLMSSTISSAALLVNRLGGRFLLWNIDWDRSNVNSGGGGYTTRMNQRRHHNRHHEVLALFPSSTHSLHSTTGRSNKKPKIFIQVVLWTFPSILQACTPWSIPRRPILFKSLKGIVFWIRYMRNLNNLIIFYKQWYLTLIL